MLNQKEILSTIEMIDQQHLDIRTITMGISLLSCGPVRKSMIRSPAMRKSW